MKKIIFLILILFLIIISGCDNQEESTIYVSIVSHNEEPKINVHPDFVENENIFWEHRSAIINFAEMLKKENVMYNYQSDWNFLLAANMYDIGTEETNDKNLIKYLKEDLEFEIDPHAHESNHNYADVAHLIETLGVKPSNIAGGYIALPPEDSKVEYFQEELNGWKYNNQWKADAIWGAGTSLHQNEEQLWISGIWRPKSNEEFFVDDETKVPNIGGYKSNWQGLNNLIEKQQNGELEDGIYTVTIFVSQNDILKEEFRNNFRNQIREANSKGNIKWVGLQEVLEIWEEDFNSEPNLLYFN